MSLFFLANSGAGSQNARFTCQFRDEMNIPAHAKVSVVKAYIPLNGLIVIDGVNRQNNQFVLTIRNPPISSPASLHIRLLCTIPDGRYTAADFANALEAAINSPTLFQAIPAGGNTGGAFPAQNPWSFASPGIVGTEFNEPNTYTAEVEYITTPDATGTPQNYYLISMSNNIKIAFATQRTLLFSLNFSGNDGGVAFNGGGTGINGLSYILSCNYIFDKTGLPVSGFGKVSNEFVYLSNQTAPQRYQNMILQPGPQVNFNGQDDSTGNVYTNALIIDIPELSTELYNAYTGTRSSSVCVVPYSSTQIAAGYVLYEPPFPLELQCGNEDFKLFNTLTVYINNADGTPALCQNNTEKTYVVLRIETEKDIEKGVLYEVKRDKRKERIKRSPLYLTGGTEEFINPGKLPTYDVSLPSSSTSSRF